jgi:sec-independent protein translocase protein TatA
MPFTLGAPELIIILVIVLVVFGAGRLPGALSAVGRGVKEYKKTQAEDGTEAPPGGGQDPGVLSVPSKLAPPG